MLLSASKSKIVFTGGFPGKNLPSGKMKKRDVYRLMLYLHVSVQFPQLMHCVCSLYLWKSFTASPNHLFFSPELACLGLFDMYTALNVCLPCTFIHLDQK